MNRFRHTVSVLSLVMVLLLLAGCLPKVGVTEYTLTVNVKPEGAAEVKDVAEKYAKNVVATFKLIANEGYEFVGWEGDVKPTKTDDGQWEIRMDGDKTLTAVFEVVEDPEEPEEPEEPEPVDEEALVQAVRNALGLEDEEEALKDFMYALEALQDAGLLTDVVEEHGPAYLEQARYFPKFGKFALSNTPYMPYMRDAADIQELIIDPVNEWVAEAIGAINGARTPAETKKAWKRFKGHGKSLLDFEGLDELTFDDHVVEELLVKYPPLSVADIRDIVYGAYVKDRVDALFDGETVAGTVEQKQIDEVAELVAEVAIDGFKAELEAEVVKAQAWFIWGMITSDQDDALETLETWIVNNMTFTQFDNLPYRQRIDVVLILSGLYEDKPDENFEQFIREFTQAVVPGVGKYLELLGAVNAAATNSQMIEALKGLEYYTDYVDQWDVFADYVGEDYYTQLRLAEGILLKVPFETISDIADELQRLIEQGTEEQQPDPPVPATP